MRDIFLLKIIPCLGVPPQLFALFFKKPIPPNQLKNSFFLFFLNFIGRLCRIFHYFAIYSHLKHLTAIPPQTRVTSSMITIGSPACSNGSTRNVAFMSWMPWIIGKTPTNLCTNSGMTSNGSVAPEKISMGKYNIRYFINHSKPPVFLSSPYVSTKIISPISALLNYKTKKSDSLYLLSNFIIILQPRNYILWGSPLQEALWVKENP